MKTFTAPLTFHLKSQLKSLCTCWHVKRSDGVVQGFTDFQDDLTVNGVLYRSLGGYSPTAVESSSSFAVDNMEVSGLLNSGALLTASLVGGIYDGAELNIFMVNSQAPDDGAIQQAYGVLGQVRYEQGSFNAELRGLKAYWQQNILDLYSKTCRAEFGDEDCQLDAALYTFQGAITALPRTLDNRTFTAEGLTQAAGTFNYGKLRFTNGQCAGMEMEVKTHSAGGAFALMLAMPFELAVGDTFSVVTGCDSSKRACQTFGNYVNFQGESDIPEENSILFPKTR